MNDSALEGADQLVQVWPGNIRTAQPDDTPFLVLEERGGDRMLPIAIGPSEATSITFAMQHVSVERPQTHDALKQAIDVLGGTVVRIVVGFRADAHAFTADVVVTMPYGGDRHLDWRVSDAIALAVRCDPAPSVLVPEALLADPAPSLTSPHWPDRVRVRCACGAWINAGEQLVSADPAADLLEVDLDCQSCGERRHFRIQRPPEAQSPAAP